jgi:hypothetical protein
MKKKEISIQTYRLFQQVLSMEQIISIEGFVESGTWNRKIDRNRELDVPKAAKIVVKHENMRLVVCLTA